MSQNQIALDPILILNTPIQAPNEAGPSRHKFSYFLPIDTCSGGLAGRLCSSGRACRRRSHVGFQLGKLASRRRACQRTRACLKLTAARMCVAEARVHVYGRRCSGPSCCDQRAAACGRGGGVCAHRRWQPLPPQLEGNLLDPAWLLRLE